MDSSSLKQGTIMLNIIITDFNFISFVLAAYGIFPMEKSFYFLKTLSKILLADSPFSY